jgi:hypothetical protein
MDEAGDAPPKSIESEIIKLDLAKAYNSFAELYELLEDHGPLWYSEKIHDRALGTLDLLRATLGLGPPYARTTTH